jgi:hypothetical protein
VPFVGITVWSKCSAAFATSGGDPSHDGQCSRNSKNTFCAVSEEYAKEADDNAEKAAINQGSWSNLSEKQIAMYKKKVEDYMSIDKVFALAISISTQPNESLW